MDEINEVTKSIPLSKLNELKEIVEVFANPKVTYSDDADLMLKERDEVRKRQIYLILTWVNNQLR